MQSSRGQRFENARGLVSLGCRLRGRRSASRSCLALTGVVVALTFTPASALAAAGDLTQKSGQAGCVRQTNNSGGQQPDPLCTDGTGVEFSGDVAVSPDGKNAYAATRAPGAVAIFNRNPATGELTQRPGLQACISENGLGGSFAAPPCQDGKALQFANSIAVSPDGKNVYVTSQFGVSIFDRDAATGALTQKADPQGCFSETGRSVRTDPATAGQCGDGTGFSFPTSVTFSPDSKTAYVASQESDSVAVLDRDTTTGVLTQRAAPAGCISDTGRSTPGDPATAGQCQDGEALDGAFSVTVSLDGKNVYAVSEPSNAVAIFDRDVAGGVTQKSGPAGCVSETGTGGACADGKALVLTSPGFGAPPRAVAVSPDGKSVYVAADGSDAVAIFDRDAAGALTQKPDRAGCVSEDGTAGACADGNALDRPGGVAVSPDGQSAYVTSFAHNSNTPQGLPGGGNGSAVVILDRDLSAGALTQRAGAAGCIQDDTATGATGACTKGHGLVGANSPTLSPDGKNVYVASSYRFGTVTIFDRELPPDADNDGVFDALDRCPNQAGPASNQGCPTPGPTASGGGYALPPGSGGGGGSSVPPKATVCANSAGVRVIGRTNSGGRVIQGTRGNDRICGTSAGDLLTGNGGRDVISGGGGNDRINGGSGSDRVNGGSGKDLVSGGSGNDSISGSSGNDRVNGNSGRDRISGGSGNDRLNGSTGSDVVSGSSGRDVISGSSGSDRLSGNSGNDRLNGNSGDDRISGGSGTDAISARDRRRDRVSCGSGRDRASADRVDRLARDCERVKRR